MPVRIDELETRPEPRPERPAAGQDKPAAEAAAQRVIDLLRLAREREARLAPP